MSEGKKAEFRRDTCKEKLKGFLQRAVDINTGKADYKYYNRIKEIVLFGSLVNTDKEKVHDIDLLVIWDDDRELGERFHEEHPYIFRDWLKDMFSEWYSAEKYLRGGAKVFSIHSNVVEGKRIYDIVNSDKHIILASDHNVIFANLALIP